MCSYFNEAILISKHLSRDRKAVISHLTVSDSFSCQILMKFVPKGPIDNKSAFFRIMAYHRIGDKPISEPKIVSLLTHTCLTGLIFHYLMTYMRVQIVL